MYIGDIEALFILVHAVLDCQKHTRCSIPGCVSPCVTTMLYTPQVDTHDGVRRVSGLRREPAVSWTSRISVYPTEKQTPTLVRICVGRETFEVMINPHTTLMRGSESTFQLDTQICVGSSTETAGSLHTPKTLHTPSHVRRIETSSLLKFIWLWGRKSSENQYWKEVGNTNV